MCLCNLPVCLSLSLCVYPAKCVKRNRERERAHTYMHSHKHTYTHSHKHAHIQSKHTVSVFFFFSPDSVVHSLLDFICHGDLNHVASSLGQQHRTCVSIWWVFCVFLTFSFFLGGGGVLPWIVAAGACFWSFHVLVFPCAMAGSLADIPQNVREQKGDSFRIWHIALLERRGLFFSSLTPVSLRISVVKHTTVESILGPFILRSHAGVVGVPLTFWI